MGRPPTHGHTINGKPSRTWRTWKRMIERCEFPNDPRYHHYGGRGIKVCKRWHTFQNFLDDMGVKPPGLTLERVDNDDDYKPSNCCWATYKEQNRNNRHTVLDPAAVADIRSRPNMRGNKQGRSVWKELAEEYGVSMTYIKQLRSRQYDHIWR